MGNIYNLEKTASNVFLLRVHNCKTVSIPHGRIIMSSGNPSDVHKTVLYPMLKNTEAVLHLLGGRSSHFSVISIFF